MAEHSFDSVVLSRTPKVPIRLKVSVLTLDADSLLPPLTRPATRNRSEIVKSKLPFHRACKLPDESEDHMEALSIHNSPSTLVSTAHTFSVREKLYRSSFAADRRASLGRGKLRTAGLARTAISITAISSTESEDSNELDIDLAKFIRSPNKRSINVKEITVEEVFARRLRAQISPLSHLRHLKQRDRVSYSPATVAKTAVTRSLLQTFNKTRGGLKTPGEEGLELRGLRAYRRNEEPKLQRKSKMKRGMKGRLRGTEGGSRLEV